MTRLNVVTRDYRAAGALNGLLNLVGFVDDGVFLTKSGDVGLVIAIEGLDDECLDTAQREQVVQQFAQALRLFDERFRIYQYLLKRPAASPSVEPQDDAAPTPTSSRAAFLADRHLFRVEVRFVVMFEPARDRQVWWEQLRTVVPPLVTRRCGLSERRLASEIETRLHTHIAHLRAQVEAFCGQVAEGLRPRVMGGREAYGFLRDLLNYAPEKADAANAAPDRFLDLLVADSALECHRGYLRLDDEMVRLLTLKEPPAQSYAAMLRDLYALPVSFIAVTEWRREPQGAMRRTIHAKRRHFHNAKASLANYLQSSAPMPDEMLIDDGASALVSDLGACLRDLEMQGHYFGSFSLTLVVHGPDRETVQRGVSAVTKVLAAHDASLTDERYNLLNAWLATIPGGADRNLRSMYVLNTNYADLSFLFAIDSGHSHNDALHAPCLAVLETQQHTPYALNLHRHDVAHTVILGSTGSGKSFLLNFLITHAQQYRPYTIIFDLGSGYAPLTRRFGGSYLQMGLDHRAFTINPFALDLTPEHRHFLFAFVKVLAETAGQYRLTAQDDHELHEQIGNLYEVDRDQRRLVTLVHMLPRTLALHLTRWVDDGSYASLFDQVEDTVTLSRFQCVDFAGMDRYPELLEPLLFYVLHRANASIYAPETVATLKLFVMDEAWRFLLNPAIKAYVTEALKTWRKRNAAMVLATQSTDDLDRSDVLRVVVESCASKCFLANAGCDPRVYRDIFGLNATEIDRIVTLVPRQQFLFTQGDGAKVLNLHVEPESEWLYTKTPSDRVRAQAVLSVEAGTASLDSADR
jgi:type IV secretion system protein VirB4